MDVIADLPQLYVNLTERYSSYILNSDHRYRRLKRGHKGAKTESPPSYDIGSAVRFQSLKNGMACFNYFAKPHNNVMSQCLHHHTIILLQR